MKDSRLKWILVGYYEFFYEWKRMLILRVFHRLRIMSYVKTILYIKNNNCSIARFGDGELDMILRPRTTGFQNHSDALANSLKCVIENRNPKLLLCIPGVLNSTRDSKTKVWIEWGRYGHQEKVVSMIRNLHGRFRIMGDSQITRPYIDWKTDKRAKKIFPLLKQLWEDRDILIVEGRYTCLGIGNDLFDSAKSIKRIIAPAVGAFERYDEILNSVIKNHENRLILLALGPTATVLASDLADYGLQALDIGHIDIEYEWFLMKADHKIPIPGKYTNEAMGKEELKACTDPVYISQIIDVIE